MSSLLHVRRAADLTCGERRAWRVNPGIDTRPEAKACLAMWLVNGPFHPHWSYWMVGVIHLREIEGVSRKPYLQFPGASHEFMIAALLSPPADPVEPDPDVLETLRIMQPVDCMHQELGLTDVQAVEIGGLIVRAAVEKGWTLDSDARHFWQGTLARTAEHFRIGGHPE